MIRQRQFSFWMVLAVVLAAPFLLTGRPVQAQSSVPEVLVLTADGPLTPAMGDYLERGIQTAEKQGAEMLILQLNTPGGSIDLMTKMVTDIRASRIPVIVYVSPRGAMAGSAGTMITLAGHAAAMAPETAIGAASPVGPNGEDLGTTLEAKEKNILKATVRSLAAQRSPQAISLAESTIDSAAAVSSEEAKQAGLVDFIANDLNDLVRQLDGLTVQTEAGQKTLHTTGLLVVRMNNTFIEQVLALLTNPNIVFLLLIVGVQAILIELSSPGGWVAGFIGVVCLALSAYGLGILPVNWFGLIFIATAFVLFILDVKSPTHGALTLAGVGSLIAGALVLFNSPGVPSFERVSVPLVVGTSLASGAMFFGILMFALRSQKIPVLTGQKSLVGRTGSVKDDLNPEGTVQLGSELWTAQPVEGEPSIPKGTRVQVVFVKGVRLFVKREI